MTQGKGEFSMEYSKYCPALPGTQDQLMRQWEQEREKTMMDRKKKQSQEWYNRDIGNKRKQRLSNMDPGPLMAYMQCCLSGENVWPSAGIFCPHKDNRVF